MLTVDEIREKFLTFMESRGHQREASDNLVPQNDPTLLFTGAGMNQFKAQFNGIGITHPRVTTSQKCLRTGDIENVGRTPRHNTFFEMLGYFSFGDYFKEEAIPLCWDFLAKEMQLPTEKLWVTIYEDDDEAEEIWKKLVPPERIVRLGEEDNFWPASAPSQGPNGPCGPCSEVHMDLGEAFCPDDPRPGGTSDRFFEVCNIVFTQFERQEGGVLKPLPQKNIDFGMGLERLAMVVQGVNNVFQIDSYRELEKRFKAQFDLEELTENQLPPFRRAMDHMRSVVFCIAEGVQPSPNHQGYVIRRLLRRAILDIYELGLKEPVLYRCVADVAEVMRGGYPDLMAEIKKVSSVIEAEEKSFQKTVRSGRQLFDRHIAELQTQGATTLKGDVVFDLYSTYGFPVELTYDLAEDHGLKVDVAGFEEALKRGKEVSKEGSKISADVFVESPAHLAKKYLNETTFTGYASLEEKTEVTVLIQGGTVVNELNESEKGILVVACTPFYAESGGQLGDQGWAQSDTFQARVLDTQKEAGIWLHSIEVTSGKITQGDPVTLTVDAETRQLTMSNHSATHLMNWALRKVLGDGISQAGSQVGPHTLRFDFSYSSPLTPEEVTEVEDLVNKEIWQANTSDCTEMSLDEAKKSGAIAMFGEKYGQDVRVMTIGASKELCGGTHVQNTGEIGLFKIIGQEAVGSGVRRLIAMTREKAIDWQRRRNQLLEESSKSLKTSVDDLPQRAKGLSEELQTLRKKLSSESQAQSQRLGNDLKNRAQEENGLRILLESLPEGVDPISVYDSLKGELDVVYLAAKTGKKVNLLIGLGKKAQEKGLKAGDLMKFVAPSLDGKGGGAPHLARGSGTKPAAIDDSMTLLRDKISEY